MGVVNRVLLVLLDLAMLVVTVVLGLVSLGWFTAGQLSPVMWIQDRLEPLAHLTNGEQAWSVGICSGLIVLGLVLLFFELKPNTESGRVTLKQDALGRVTVTRDGIEALVTREAASVPGVLDARGHVDEDNGRFRVREWVSVDPAVNVLELAQTVRERVKESIEQHLGRTVSDVRVDTQLKPLGGGRRVR